MKVSGNDSVYYSKSIRDIVVQVDVTEGSYEVELVQSARDSIFSKGFTKAMLLKLPVYSQVDLTVNATVLIGVTDTKFYEYNQDTMKFNNGSL